MRITPKMRVRPLASRNSSAPYDTPLKIWISQNFASKSSSSDARVAEIFSVCSYILCYEAPRANHLLAHSQARAAQAARRRAHGGLDHRQRRGMGHRPDDAAHRAAAAGGRRPDARHPELGMARVRQPGRVLAVYRNS